MDNQTLIKIWIQVNDLQMVSESKRPTVFWLTKPTYHQNLIEMMIPYSVVAEWQNSSPVKTLLKD